MMSPKRVSKKLVPSLEDIDGALLMVNAVDPQYKTIDVFLEAIEGFPHYVIVNKVDAVSVVRAQEILDKLNKQDALLASVINRRGIGGIKKAIASLPQGKIAVLGIFNSGKTSLINALTRENNPVGDIPGTTLQFTEHPYEAWILIDTVGQVIDVSKPLMVSVDLTLHPTIAGKLTECMVQDRSGIDASLMEAVPQLERAVKVIKEQVDKGSKLIIVGAGASALVAMEIAGQAQETGLPALVFTNNLATCQPVSFAKGLGEDELAMAKYVALSVQAGDIVIGISASGGTGFVHELLFIARKKKAITIAITENVDTPLGKASDIIIKSNAKPEGPSSSKIQAAHLAIGHALILTLADIRGITAEKSIEYMLPDIVPTKKMGIK